MSATFQFSRRNALRSLALAPEAARSILRAASERPLGLALYTVRDALQTRPAEVLQLIAKTGYAEIEVLRNQIQTLRPLLPSSGLRPVSVHFETPIITGNWQAWRDAEMPPVDERLTFDRVLEEAGTCGIRNLVFNYLPPKERGELDYYRRLAEKLNAAAQKCQRAGAKLWYHNHNFEFARKPDGRPIDVLLSRLDFQLISLEADLFWLGMAGENPVNFIRQNAGRIVAVHLKDRQRGATVPRFDIASVPNSTYEEVGRGEMNFADILTETRKAGVAHHFVEQDHTPDPLGAIQRSYAAVRKIGF